MPYQPPHSRRLTLLVSGGPVRGCGVYCGEDVQSCRFKSLTSLVPTGELCGVGMWPAEGSVRGGQQTNVSDIESRVFI